MTRHCRSAAVVVVALALVGCSRGASETTRESTQPRQIEAVLADGQLGRLVAAGPVMPGQAFWSGVPVPKLQSGEPYVINSVAQRSGDVGRARVRVGVTAVAPLGAAPEPPDAYEFEGYPFEVQENDSTTTISVSIELNGEESAEVQGVVIDATLSDGRLVRMVLPLAVAACEGGLADAAARCSAISDASYAALGDDPDAWGVFNR